MYKYKTIEKYFDAYFKWKKYTVFHGHGMTSDFIVNCNDKNDWLIELTISGYCYYRYDIFIEICEIFDIIDSHKIEPYIAKWVKKRFNREIVGIMYRFVDMKSF